MIWPIYKPRGLRIGDENEWMNEWMYEWMSEWINEQMNEWMNEWMNERMNEYVNAENIILMLILCSLKEKKVFWYIKKISYYNNLSFLP